MSLLVMTHELTPVSRRLRGGATADFARIIVPDMARIMHIVFLSEASWR